MRRFLAGFTTYLRGLRLWLGNGALLRISVVPFVLDLFCLALGIYYTATHVSGFVERFVHAPHAWYQYILYSVFYAVTALTLFFVIVFVVIIFANLIVFPFNDRLAERTLRLQGLEVDRAKSTGARLGKSIRNTAVMLEKLAILLGVGSLLAVGTLLIPGFGILAGAAGAFLIALDRLDYSFDQYQLSLAQRLRLVRTHFAEVLGFSAAMGLVTAIPGLNLLLMPGGVVAGAVFAASILRSDLRDYSDSHETPGHR